MNEYSDVCNIEWTLNEFEKNEWDWQILNYNRQTNNYCVTIIIVQEMQ